MSAAAFRAYNAPPGPLAVFSGPTSKEGEGRGRAEKGTGGRGREEKGRGREGRAGEGRGGAP